MFDIRYIVDDIEIIVEGRLAVIKLPFKSCSRDLAEAAEILKKFQNLLQEKNRIYVIKCKDPCCKYAGKKFLFNGKFEEKKPNEKSGKKEFVPLASWKQEDFSPPTKDKDLIGHPVRINGRDGEIKGIVNGDYVRICLYPVDKKGPALITVKIANLNLEGREG